MIQIKVKPIDEHNPEKVLELLNLHKSNLSTLLLQYNTIIETYLKILGISGLGLANVNEVILPEIQNLLKKQAYDYEFRETGIYVDNKVIFSVQPNKEAIHIESSGYFCSINKCIINSQRGLLLKKDIEDFSKLDESDKNDLSPYASSQINQLSFDFPLKSLEFHVSISEGVELSKMIFENYCYSKSSNDIETTLKHTFSYYEKNPTIFHEIKVFLSDGFKEYLEQNRTQYSSYLNDSPYMIKPSSFIHDNGGEIYHNILYNYGELKLHDTPANYVPGYHYSPYSPKRYNYYPLDPKFEYDKLINNLKAYKNKYNMMHPLMTFTRNWYQNRVTEKVRSYIKDNFDNDRNQK